MSIRDTSPPGEQNPGEHKKSSYKYPENKERQSLPQKQPPQINDCSTQGYRENAVTKEPVSGSDTDNGLSQVQQQFVLRFCRQLASVIAACEQSESAEIEVGRRHIDTSQVKVKLQAEREYSDSS